METVTSAPHYITPTYQAVLNKTIMIVIERMTASDTLGSWEALKLLYRISPPSVKMIVKKDFVKISNAINLAQRRMRNTDSLLEDANLSKEIKRILHGQNELFFESIVDSLHDQNYLEKKSRPYETNVSTPLEFQ